MSKIEEVLEYIRSNTFATNKEISDDLNISEGVVRTYLNRLKNKGYLEKIGTEYKVLKEMPVSKSNYKQEIIKEMLESYMDDFRELKVINEKVRIGELIIRLVDKLQVMGMFLINDSYYELVLEDGDIAVLENIRTGESLTMDIKELWNYAI